MQRKTATLAAVWFIALSLGASDAIRPPDPREGQINGIVAAMFVPADDTTNGKVGTLLSYEDCTVVLAPWANLPAERTYRCGTWFQPPDGRYRAWIEKSGNLITPTAGTFTYAAVPFRERGHGVVMPVKPGGRVALAPDVTLVPNTELRIINFDSCCSASSLGNPFDRRATASPSLRSGLLIPAGRVFVGVFDRTSNDALALARPARVEANKVITVKPQPPRAETADVFVSLIRPDVRRTREEDGVELTLDGAAPEMLFDGSDRIYAVWYGVPAKPAQLVLRSTTLQFATRTLALQSGHVTTVRGELQKLPR
jgi:hypothetical protein